MCCPRGRIPCWVADADRSAAHGWSEQGGVSQGAGRQRAQSTCPESAGVDIARPNSLAKLTVGRYRMDTLIQRADPQERRKIVFVVAVAAIFGVLLICAYNFLMSWATQDPHAAIARLNMVVGSLYVLAAPVLVLCRRLWRVGREAVAAQRYPPPGMKVIRDTEVVTGAKAALRGRLLQYFSVLVGALSVASPVLLWLLLWRIGGTA